MVWVMYVTETFLFALKYLIPVGFAVAFKSREDHRKQLELEEARKAGLAPAEVDEDGKEINPHIPQYMSSVPWYLNAKKPVSIYLSIYLFFLSLLALICWLCISIEDFILFFTFRA